MANRIDKKERKLPEGYGNIICDYLPNYSSRQDVARLNDLWFLEDKFADNGIVLATVLYNELIDLESKLYEEAAIARLQDLFTN